MELKNILKVLRNKKGQSQKKVANELGTTQQTYQRWESGQFEPDIEMLNRLACYYDVSIDFLLGKNENVKPVTLNRDVTRINVLGSVPAGVPLEAIEDIVDWEEIPSEWLKKGEYFALKLKGDSMSPKYLDGDTVIFRKQDDCDSGQNALVYINGYDATFKKIIKKNDKTFVLQPLNNEYEPIVVDRDETFKIAGVPVEIRRKDNL